MPHFIKNTLTQPSIFWGALEAIATLIASGIIIHELRRTRRETIAHKIEGFRYAMSLLNSEEFQSYIKAFRHLRDKSNRDKWRTKLPIAVQGILRTLEIVAKLKSEEYLDDEFLFKIEGLRLANLANEIDQFENGKTTPYFAEQRQLYPNGIKLLEQAKHWKDNNA